MENGSLFQNYSKNLKVIFIGGKYSKEYKDDFHGGTKGWCKGQEKCTYNRCTDPPLANMASNKKKRFLHHLLVKIVFNKFTIYKRSIHCWSWTQDTKYNFLVNSWMDLLPGNKKLIFKIRKIIPWKYILVSPSWNVLLFAFPAKYCVGDGFEKFAQVLEGFPKYSEEHQNTPWRRSQTLHLKWINLFSHQVFSSSSFFFVK